MSTSTYQSSHARLTFDFFGPKAKRKANLTMSTSNAPGRAHVSLKKCSPVIAVSTYEREGRQENCQTCHCSYVIKHKAFIQESRMSGREGTGSSKPHDVVSEQTLCSRNVLFVALKPIVPDTAKRSAQIVSALKRFNVLAALRISSCDEHRHARNVVMRFASLF